MKQYHLFRFSLKSLTYQQLLDLKLDLEQLASSCIHGDTSIYLEGTQQKLQIVLYELYMRDQLHAQEVPFHVVADSS